MLKYNLFDNFSYQNYEKLFIFEYSLKPLLIINKSKIMHYINSSTLVLILLIFFNFINLKMYAEESIANLLILDKKESMVWVSDNVFVNDSSQTQMINTKNFAYPDLTFNAGLPATPRYKPNGEVDYYSICKSSANDSSLVPFKIYPLNSRPEYIYTIDWGDGSPATTGNSTNFPFIHDYANSIGGEFWIITYTINYQGNVFTANYNLYVGSSPLLDIPALTSVTSIKICTEVPLVLDLQNRAINSSDTKYTYKFSDVLTPPVEFEFPDTLNHIFESTSCGKSFKSGTQEYLNAYGLTITAENKCGKTSVTIAGIYVSQAPEVVLGQDPIVRCEKEEFQISGIVIRGVSPDDNSTQLAVCQQTGVSYWKFLDETSRDVTFDNNVLDLTFGAFGSDNGFTNTNVLDYFLRWTEGTPDIRVIFKKPGVYTAYLSAGNNCGIDSIPQTIVINPAIIPQIKVDEDSVNCNYLKFKLSNNTDTSLLNKQEKILIARGESSVQIFTWEIYKGGVLLGSETQTYQNGIFNPQFIERQYSDTTSSGKYEVRLKYNGNACSDVIDKEIFEVPGDTKIKIGKLDACLVGTSVTVTATATIETYGINIDKYYWRITDSRGDTIYRSIEPTPSFSFNTLGKYTAFLDVTTSCGTTSAKKEFEIEPEPKILPVNNITVYSNQTVSFIPFSVTNTSQGIRWVNSDPTIGLDAKGTAIKGNEILPSFKALNTGITPITSIITVFPLNLGCQGEPISFYITVLPLVDFRPTFDYIEFNKCGNKTVKFKNLTDTTLLNNLIHNYNFKWSVSPAGYKFINQTNEFSFEPEIEFFKKDTFTIILHILNDTLNIESEPQTIFNDSLYVYAFTSDIKVKCGNSVQLNAQCNYKEEGKLKYKWRPSDFLDNDTIENPVSTPYRDIKYEIEIITPEECIVKDTIFIKTEKSDLVPIHFVGVESGKNIIVWVDEETEYRDSVFIFKETYTTNIYEKIGGVQYGDAFFIDTLSNPSITSNKYKISNKDKCGFETEKSEPHKTIHLAINKGQNNSWNLIWEPYVGFEVASYNIYRGLTPDSLKLLHKSAASVNQYTDFNAPGGYVYYQVEVIPPELRDKIKSITNLVNQNSIDLKTAKSNIVSNIENSKSQEIYCYPNPAKDFLYIQLPESKSVKVSIINFLGQELYNESFKSQLIKINLSDLRSDMYVLKIFTEDSLVTKKIFLSKIIEY